MPLSSPVSSAKWIADTSSNRKLLKDDNSKSAYELASAIRAFDEALLQDPILPGYSSAYKNLQGTAEHIYYHLGQIALLRQA
jgi:hypothetical protein